MSQETEAVRPHQASQLLENQTLSDNDAPFEIVDEEETPPFVDCEQSTQSLTGIIQKAAETSHEPRTAAPMGSIMEFQPPVDSLRTPPHSPRRDLPEIVQRLLLSANKPMNIAVDKPTPPTSLPNDSKFGPNHDQPAAEDVTPTTVDLVPDATTVSTNTEEDQERPKTPTTPTLVVVAQEHQLKRLCDKLQTGFLTPGQQPNPKNMPKMDKHLTDAEGMHYPPECVAPRKFLKVLKAIARLNYIPRDEEFGLRKRTKALREKWLDIFGDIVLPRRKQEHTIIDLTESADESPQSAENYVLNSPASSETIPPPASASPPAKRKRCSLTNGSPSSSEIRRGKRQRVTQIQLKAHFDQESSVMQNSLRNVCQMIGDVSTEIERAQARKEQLESWKAELEAWGIREEKVTRQLEKQ